MLIVSLCIKEERGFKLESEEENVCKEEGKLCEEAEEEEKSVCEGDVSFS